MENSTVRNRSGQGSKTDATVEEAPTPPQPEHTLEEYERLFGVDEDAYEQPTTTRKELWSYYLYYNGKAPKLGDFPLVSYFAGTDMIESRRQWRWSRFLQSSPVRVPN